MSEKFQHSVIQCLTAIAQHHGLNINPEQIIDDYALMAEEPTPGTLQRIAAEIGLKSKVAKLTWEGLLAQTGVFPILARLSNGAGVIILGVNKDDNNKVAILDPVAPSASINYLDREQWCAMWYGDVVFLKRNYAIDDLNQPFGFRWFIPEILKQKVAFRDIAIAAVAIQLLALATPIYFQIIIVKVLVHQSLSTLWTLTIGVVIAMLFDAIFGFLRQLLTLAASNKIDMRLTRRTFGHLLSLPIDYFETTSAGVITRHMQQLESIRNFLTGRLFFSFLDMVSLLIFLPILFTYSVKLAMIVLAFSLMIVSIIAMVLPTYRRRLDALYAAEGKRQSLLIETIHGMRTVKALAVEPLQRRIWDQISADAITMHYRLGKLTISSGAVTDFIGKLLPIMIIFIGAQDVFDNTMSVGALIGFQMLSSRVSSPLLQIVGLINEYQQTALSVRMLGKIMNTMPEGRVGAGGLRADLGGEITFDKVAFRYPEAGTLTLDRATFVIPAGKVIGIVGRSGSGKTTLTKLIQGLYPIQEGIIRFDGIDAREFELPYLRRQIGVVLQENFLFRGTVRDNIAIANPSASFEEIVAVAQAAGADEFIERLPQGYDSFLEENASNLSGGQKQRLSIARALLSKPRILILDEAASALDPESEAIFIRNLSRIAVGRTVIMISHRLSTLVNAHAILVMQQGKLIDSGSHKDLLMRCDTYQQLWNQQSISL
jgi:ATP-binding cassette subfamily B protein